MQKCLTILEVSQKQKYIFQSNKVKDNIVNSAIIAHVLGEKYIAEALKETAYSEKDNMVYSGGGHTVLEFSDREQAKKMVAELTRRIYEEFDGLVVFAKTEEFADSLSLPSCLKELTKALEKKKAMRRASFHQGSYGVEKIDSNTLEVMNKNNANASKAKEEISNTEYTGSARKYTPEGYQPVYQFEELGGTKNTSNYIAVVHVDGNGMGKRVEELHSELKNKSWEDAKKQLRAFSKAIDKDFKDSYIEMVCEVARQLKECGVDQKLSLKGNNFPVRHIIIAGDDICFVSEGRIGIECARIFMEKLAQKSNAVDGKTYAACAGVAIVHQKYPFFRAYEIAESLCSNAKKYGAHISKKDNGRSVSAIDWHIEFGELQDSLEEIRKEYTTLDQNRLELRPYIVSGPEEIMKDKKLIARKYDNFKRVINRIQHNETTYGKGKIKELRGALKKGKIATQNYLEFNQMEEILVENRPKEEGIQKADLMRLFTGHTEKGDAFLKQDDEKEHSILFDAIELMDSFIAFEEGGDSAC